MISRIQLMPKAPVKAKKTSIKKTKINDPTIQNKILKDMF